MGKQGRDAVTETVKMVVRKLFFCVMSLALAVGACHLQFYEMEMGGAVTLCSMLIVCLPAYWYGPVVGVLNGAAFGFLQYIMNPYMISPVQVFIDYGLAFAALGIAGVFYEKENGLLKGYILAVFFRYYFVVMSGLLFYSENRWEGWSPIAYSLVYNGIYIFAEAAITVFILCCPFIKTKIDIQNKRIKMIANGANPDEIPEEIKE